MGSGLLPEHVPDALPPEVAERRRDVDQKHAWVSSFLKQQGLDALLLRRLDSTAWFTSGGDASFGIAAADEGAVALFITPEARSVLATNAESPRFFEEEITSLGFQLKERRWYEDLETLIEDLCRGRRVGSDWPSASTVDVRQELFALRSRLTPLEQERIRRLGEDVAHAVQATCRSLAPGDTEAEAAGQVAHRLLRRGISPVRLFVAADDRSAEFPHPIPKGYPIQRRVQIAVVGRRHGLCAYVARTASFEPPPQDFLRRYEACLLVEASFIYQSCLNRPVSEVFSVAQRIYEKAGFPHEWVMAPQGFVLGYSPSEWPLVPDSARLLEPSLAVGWSPSVGDARTGDTVLLGRRSYRILTPAQGWPLLTVSVRGHHMELPGILVLRPSRAADPGAPDVPSPLSSEWRGRP